MDQQDRPTPRSGFELVLLVRDGMATDRGNFGLRELIAPAPLDGADHRAIGAAPLPSADSFAVWRSSDGRLFVQPLTYR